MDIDRLWKSVLAEVELSVSKATYKTQFAGSRLMSLTNGVATVGLTSPLMRTMVETRYYSLVKSILDHHTKENISVVFTVAPPKKAPLASADAGPLFAQSGSGLDMSIAAIARKARVRPEFSFDNFAVSTTNQMAYAAATAVSKTPGSVYNPLFIYGGVGVGKTHLMHAVANSILTARPHTRVVASTGEEFLNEIVEAIQTKTARQFKQRYRSAQLLLIDDVQFIAGKQTAQEEFFHTFNAVYREGGQIILVSDRHPSEIAKLEDRLRSRFEGGLTVDISPPDFELRVAIINIKSEALGVGVPTDCARLVAANMVDTRAIEGFLRRIATEVATKHISVTPEVVSSLLRLKPDSPENAAPQRRRVTPLEILEAVSSYFGVKPSALKGPRRNRPIVRPRQIFMYLCKTELGLTLDDVGGALGGRDHTTILHGVETITKELSTNAKLREDVEGIKRGLWA